MLADGAHLFKTHQLPNFMLPNLQYCLEGVRGQGVGVWGGGGARRVKAYCSRIRMLFGPQPVKAVPGR